MQIRAFSRLHIGLADMGFASRRMYGGIGFTIATFNTVIAFRPDDRFSIFGFESLDEAAYTDMERIINRLHTISGVRPFRATLLSHPPQHCGFGSKTSLALSLVAGANHLCGMSLARQEMQLLSGRGRASGVGIHSFFDGGVICDGGHRATQGHLLLPSSANLTEEIPPLLSRLDFPPQWRVMLVLGIAPALSAQDEITFFQQNAPVERQAALETIASIHHGVLPAFAAADYCGLASALIDIHSRGFKMRELGRCDERTRRCFGALTAQGFAVGLSSVGPLLYVIIQRDDEQAVVSVRNEVSAAGLTLLGETSGWNAGYQIMDNRHEA